MYLINFQAIIGNQLSSSSARSAGFLHIIIPNMKPSDKQFFKRNPDPDLPRFPDLVQVNTH
jgi:hypothetical protein